jgi:uncharacterized protein YkwD
VVSGTVVLIPQDAYGPTVIGPSTYGSNDANQTMPLGNATVIVGPVPLVGATPPSTLPAGDVTTTTSASGTFAVSVPSTPIAPLASEPFAVPPQNLSGFVPPSAGFYVEVYGLGADGVSANVPIPLHRFVAVSSALALRVSTTSTAESAALAALNSDRAANGAGPLTFDESAEEAARLHAGDMGNKNYECHYDLNDIGPASRYLAVGGIGQTGESISGGAQTASASFQYAEQSFMSEKAQTPPGDHYVNNVDVSHLWAGLATGITYYSTAAAAFFWVDYELITPSAISSAATAGYTNAFCSSGIDVNNS